MRLDDIVPFAVEFVGIDINLLHFFRRDLSSGRVFAAIQPASYAQPFCGSGLGNEVHNRFVVPQWLTTPVRRNKGKQSVFDLVPLAGSWREMTDRDG